MHQRCHADQSHSIVFCSDMSGVVRNCVPPQKNHEMLILTLIEKE